MNQDLAQLPHTTLCDISVLALNKEQVVELLRERVEAGQSTWVVTLNLEMVSRRERDPEYRKLLDSADVHLPDGMPLVWASRKKKGGTPLPGRVTGSDITADLLQVVPANFIAIVGGENPGKSLDTANVRDREKIFIDASYIKVDEQSIKSLAHRLHGRRLIFLALGVPKQDLVAQALKPYLPEASFIGVGGSFELLGKQKKRAPLWMQKSGFEWLYRLLNEPKRLWRRYLIESWTGGFALYNDIRRGKNIS